MSARRAPRRVPDKRRLILDAAVRVFARQGFHACRVSDIADEAGVAYGLVYHYFASKDEVLDTLFLERWNVMLELIREVDARAIPVREKLRAIASFIVDSYAHDPDLMKVIIVEVTRAANSFGQTAPGQIREAYDLIGGHRHARRRPKACSRRRSKRASPRWPSTARSSSCSRAGSSACCPRARSTSSAPSGSSWRRSAGAWRRSVARAAERRLSCGARCAGDRRGQ